MELEKIDFIFISFYLIVLLCLFDFLIRRIYLKYAPSHFRNILGSILIFFQGLILILSGLLCAYYNLNSEPEDLKTDVIIGFAISSSLFFVGAFLVWVSIFVDNVRIREIFNGLARVDGKPPEYMIKLHKGSDGKIKIYKKREKKEIPEYIAEMFYEKRKIKIKFFSFLILISFIIAALNSYLEFHSPFDKLAVLGAFFGFLAIPFLGVVKCPSCNHYDIVHPHCPTCGFKLKK